MVGFLLRAVYGTLVTPSLAVKWDEAEDGMCRLCHRGWYGPAYFVRV